MNDQTHTHTYRIESTSGVVLGDYQGENEQAALDAMARDAGYRDYTDASAQTDTDHSQMMITKLN